MQGSRRLPDYRLGLRGREKPHVSSSMIARRAPQMPGTKNPPRGSCQGAGLARAGRGSWPRTGSPTRQNVHSGPVRAAAQATRTPHLSTRSARLIRLAPKDRWPRRSAAPAPGRPVPVQGSVAVSRWLQGVSRASHQAAIRLPGLRRPCTAGRAPLVAMSACGPANRRIIASRGRSGSPRTSRLCAGQRPNRRRLATRTSSWPLSPPSPAGYPPAQISQIRSTRPALPKPNKSTH